jgi:hypothetical protein
MIIAILNMFHQHIESRLWNLQSGDDWSDMCSTTPATFRGLHFDSPEICENWVRIYLFIFLPSPLRSFESWLRDHPKI